MKHVEPNPQGAPYMFQDTVSLPDACGCVCAHVREQYCWSTAPILFTFYRPVVDPSLPMNQWYHRSLSLWTEAGLKPSSPYRPEESLLPNLSVSKSTWPTFQEVPLVKSHLHKHIVKQCMFSQQHTKFTTAKCSIYCRKRYSPSTGWAPLLPKCPIRNQSP